MPPRAALAGRSTRPCDPMAGSKTWAEVKSAADVNARFVVEDMNIELPR